MLVKKTKSGKLSCVMTHTHREFIFNTIQSLMSTRSVGWIEVQIINCVLMELLLSKNLFLHINSDTKIILKRSEALALLFMLKSDSTMTGLDIKGSLHQILS